MKNFVFGIVLAAVLFSCNNSKEKTAEKKISNVRKASVKDSLPENETVSGEEFKNDFDILLPRSYRTYDGQNPVTALSEKWIELYEENGKYFLGKANFKIENDFDQCTGDSLKIISPKNKVIVFINSPELKTGDIESLKINKKTIWPGEKSNLKFNNLKYDFHANGKVLSKSKKWGENDKEEDYMEVEHYKLYLTTGNAFNELLITADTCDGDAFVQLLFAGDIDQDGKLDFVFGANRNYEEERVILFLSSKADKGKAVKKVAEIAVQFDC